MPNVINDVNKKCSRQINLRIESLISVFTLVVSFVCACTFLYFVGSSGETQFEDAALLKGTTSVYSTVEGVPIHGTGIRTAAAILEASQRRNPSERIVWLGNSQLHAINQYEIGQQTTSLRLYTSLRNENTDVLTFSQPNSNLQEHYLLFEYLRTHIPIDLLLIPAVFDDTRETGLRADIATALDDSETVENVKQTETGRLLLYENKGNAPATNDYEGVKATIQEKSEKLMNAWLDKHSSVWKNRSEARGRFFLELYNLRNILMHISPESKRPLIPNRYKSNLDALRDILKVTHEDGIRVLVYIAPIRQDVPLPYYESEYASFKKEVEGVASSFGATFANFEGIIPAACWGKKDATTIGGGLELDFMHFTAEGHRIFASELVPILADTLHKEIGR